MELPDTPASPTPQTSPQSATALPRLWSTPPRWMILLGCVGTFGLWPIAFYVREAANAKSLGERKIWLWMWLLVPLFPITLPFATSRINDAYEAFARNNGVEVKLTDSRYGWLMLLAYLILAVVGEVGGRFQWTLLIAAFMSVGFVASLHAGELARTREALLVRSLIEVRKANPALRGVALVIFVFITGFLVWLAVKSDLRSAFADSISEGERWHDAQGRFSLGVESGRADEWLILPVGTQSDGSAAAEFQLDSSVLAFVYVYGPADSPKELAESRREGFAELGARDCREHRYLREPGGASSDFVVLNLLRCEGDLAGNIDVFLSHTAQLGEQLVEVTVQGGSTRLRIKRSIEAMTAFATSLRLAGETNGEQAARPTEPAS